MSAARGRVSQGEVVDLAASRPDAHLKLEVAARAGSVGDARHAVASFLQVSALPSVIVEDLALVTSELVTNALVHPIPSDHPIRVDVSVGGAVTLEVAHWGPDSALPPVATWEPAPPAEPSGRGLGIVRRLCDDVVVRQDGGWTVISCRRRLPDRAGPR
jgi:anti-sigma regulatory factor (Ser/Thr protein kinase)